MAYCTGSHTKFYHRYHIVWVTKYRFKVLHGDMRVRLREIIRQTCSEMGVRIEKGVLSNDPVHMFVSIPPHLVDAGSRGASRKIQMEFPVRKRYWGRRFWARGYFSTTSGNVTDDSYFSIWSFTPNGNLPASAGSGLVTVGGSCDQGTICLPAYHTNGPSR